MADEEVELTAQQKRNAKRHQRVNVLLHHEQTKALEHTQRNAEVSGKRQEHLAFEARSFILFLLLFVLSVVWSVPGLEGLAIIDGTVDALISKALPASVSAIERNFTAVDSFSLLQNYLENTLYNAVYSASDSGYLNQYNFVLGGVRVRQLRVTADSSCEFSYGLTQTASSASGWDCRGNWEHGDEDTATFNGFSWTSADQNGNVVFGRDAKLTSLRTNIKYPGSGYVVDLGTDRTTALSTIQALSTNSYFDNILTAAVIVEFSTYNPTSYLHQNVQLLFERTSAGTLVPTSTIRLARIYRYPTESTQRNVSLLLDLLNTLYILYFVFAELKQMTHPNIREILAEEFDEDGPKSLEIAAVASVYPPEPYWKRPFLYFLKLTDGWECLHLANVCVFVIVLVMNMIWFLTPDVYNYSAQPSTSTFQNLAPFVSYYETTKSVNAFNLLISFFKLFKFCKLSGTINVLWLTLTESSKYLFGYVIMLFLVLFGLAAMTYTVFGDSFFRFTYLDLAFSDLLTSLQSSINFFELAERSLLVLSLIHI
eukprot:TRINITY_DN3953_c0_g2_i1.p1 TRINITY_DN3953_c0_g2~~TRINITY_DN3953_c0_g2_i1.p1  ORF type:complete len:540 (+),score=151.26 TRINITY_DN3953_c0_g2_i1:240-1859(+)